MPGKVNVGNFEYTTKKAVAVAFFCHIGVFSSEIEDEPREENGRESRDEKWKRVSFDSGSMTEVTFRTLELRTGPTL